MLITAVSQKMTSKIFLGSPVRPEDLKQSQYFDAMETIREEIDEIDEGINAQHSTESGIHVMDGSDRTSSVPSSVPV